MERAELTSPNADGSPGSASPAASMSGAGTSMTPEGGLDAWLPCLDASGQTVRRTLLMQACQSGSLQLVRMLLDAGVSVAAAAPEDGHTALHAAAACADATAALEAIKLLLSVPGGQALLALKDASGNTPLDCFLRKGLGALPSDSLAPQHPQQAVPEQVRELAPAPCGSRDQCWPCARQQQAWPYAHVRSPAGPAVGLGRHRSQLWLSCAGCCRSGLFC